MVQHLVKPDTNCVTKVDFINAMRYFAQISISGIEQKDVGKNPSAQHFKPNRVLKQLADIFERNDYSLQQIKNLFDINGDGILTIDEFNSILRKREIEIGLNDVRTLQKYFVGMGKDRKILVDHVITQLLDVINQGTEGLYSLKQAKTIIKKILREIECDKDLFTDELLKFDKTLVGEEVKGDISSLGKIEDKTGIPKIHFYKLLSRFRAFVTEEEKEILNSAFEFTGLPSMLDTRKILNIIEALPEAKSKSQQNSAEWEKRMYRKIGDFLRKKGMTVIDCFSLGDVVGAGYITYKQLIKFLIDLGIDVPEKDLIVLLSSSYEEGGKIRPTDFAKKLYESYLLDVQFFLIFRLKE